MAQADTLARGSEYKSVKHLAELAVGQRTDDPRSTSSGAHMFERPRFLGATRSALVAIALLLGFASVAMAVSAAPVGPTSPFGPDETVTAVVLDANTSVVRIQRDRPLERADEWTALLAVLVPVVAAVHTGWTPIGSRVDPLTRAALGSIVRPRSPPTST